jgi:hypothetical protein
MNVVPGLFTVALFCAAYSHNILQIITNNGWSGRRESNPRMQLGKLPFYH